MSILLLTAKVFGQRGIESINGFKYAVVDVLTYQNNAEDIFGVSEYLRSELSKKGLIVLENNSASWPQEAKIDPCLVGRWFPFTSSYGMADGMKAGYVIKNCKQEIIYESNSWGRNMGHFGNDFEANAKIAIKKAFKPIRSFSYKFTYALTPRFEYPTVESTTETEQSLKTYFDNNKLDPIEGIYKSYQNDQVKYYYKFGIVKSGDKFKAIIIESDLKQWKAGEVKAYYEPSSLKGLYSVKWLMANKTPIQTFASMENEAILSIDLKPSQTNENGKDRFIKMYPATTGSLSSKPDKSKASGSGFFISTNGIVATNAHLIDDVTKIELIITNELGTFTYKAKILLNDSKNDVALLQIDDSNFKELSSIPYSLIEKADVGEKIFTLGYPLNDIMGINYKVTDGIISSKSGLADDVRYYQISAPLQPGNSGGPLFNKDGNVIGITSSRLNSKAVGEDIENVNYAIKISYLLNLYNMLPNTKQQPNSSQLLGKELQEQIKILKNYVCLIKIY